MSLAYLTPEQQFEQQVLALIETARQRPGRNLEIRDQTGAVIATLHAHETPKRPKDMPRVLRPKQKLSKRQRTQAKHAKLAAREADPA